MGLTLTPVGPGAAREEPAECGGQQGADGADGADVEGVSEIDAAKQDEARDE
jgi:hypothetical protein